MGISQLRTAMAWQRQDRVEKVVSPLLRDSPGFALVPEVAPLDSEAIFDKLSMSPFEGTPLEFALRDLQITAFAIVGVAMEVGIEPTVRHGADRGPHPRGGHRCLRRRQPRPPRSARSTPSPAGDALLTDISTITALLAPAAVPSRS